jgi:hypothetical protein
MNFKARPKPVARSRRIALRGLITVALDMACSHSCGCGAAGFRRLARLQSAFLARPLLQ